MTFLKPRGMPVAQEINDASRHLQELFSSLGTKEFYREALQDDLAEKFSDWVSCFIYRVFNYVYTESELQIQVFLTAIGKVKAEGHVLDLITLRQKAMARYGDVVVQLMKLKEEHKASFRVSYTSLQKALDRDAELTRQITSLQESMKPTLDLFLLVEKIVIILVQENKISEEVIASLKKNMLDNPAEFSAALLPILKLLETGEASYLDRVIELTLKLVKIDSPELVSDVALALVRQGYLIDDTTHTKESAGEASIATGAEKLRLDSTAIELKSSAMDLNEELPALSKHSLLPPIPSAKSVLLGSSHAKLSQIDGGAHLGFAAQSHGSLSSHSVLPPIDTPPISPVQQPTLLASPIRSRRLRLFPDVVVPTTIVEDGSESDFFPALV